MRNKKKKKENGYSDHWHTETMTQTNLITMETIFTVLINLFNVLLYFVEELSSVFHSNSSRLSSLLSFFFE